MVGDVVERQGEQMGGGLVNENGSVTYSACRSVSGLPVTTTVRNDGTSHVNESATFSLIALRERRFPGSEPPGVGVPERNAIKRRTINRKIICLDVILSRDEYFGRLAGRQGSPRQTEFRRNLER